MLPKIAIQKIYNKGSGKLNEDELLFGDDIFAVFDGATGLVRFISKEGKTGGKIAAEIAKQVFSKNRRPLKELAVLANSQILSETQKAWINPNQKEALWSTAAAVIRLNKKETEFFQIGDCLILAIYKDGSYGLLTQYQDHDLETMILWRKLADKKEKDIYQKLMEQIIKVRRETNVKYGVLNGEKEAAEFFNLRKIQLNNIKSLILLTDGLIIPKENPEAPEDWSLFVELYQKRGLVGLLRYIRSLEEKDPYCWQYPRLKKHDDVAAIGIDFQA